MKKKTYFAALIHKVDRRSIEVFPNFVKIGSTTNLKKRRVALQMGTPFPIIMMSYTEDHEEKDVHKMFKHIRLKKHGGGFVGEWFKWHTDMIEFLYLLDNWIEPVQWCSKGGYLGVDKEIVNYFPIRMTEDINSKEFVKLFWYEDML